MAQSKVLTVSSDRLSPRNPRRRENSACRFFSYFYPMYHGTFTIHK